MVLPRGGKSRCVIKRGNVITARRSVDETALGKYFGNLVGLSFGKLVQSASTHACNMCRRPTAAPIAIQKYAVTYVGINLIA